MTTTQHLQPFVVGLMPTKNRPEMARRAIHEFLDQDYPGAMRLMVWDDTPDPERAVIPCSCCAAHRDREVRFHFHADEPGTCAPKRNRMMEQAILDGADDETIFVLWDDDDLHGKHRVTLQVETLLAHPDKQLCLITPWTLYHKERQLTRHVIDLPCDAPSAYRLSYWTERPWGPDPYGGARRITEQRPETIVHIAGPDEYVVVRHGDHRTGEPSASYRGHWWKPSPYSVEAIEARIRTAEACRSPR